MMILKAKALVVGLMVAGGVAAPIATFYGTQPSERPLPAKTDLVPEVAIPTIAAPAPAPAVVMSELSVEPTPKPLPKATLVAKASPAVAPAPDPEPEKRCTKRQLQGVGSGAVLICDVQRTSIEKPKRLAPRDLPSPSGLLLR